MDEHASRRHVERLAAIPERLGILAEHERWSPDRRAAWVRERVAEQLRAAALAPYWRGMIGPDTELEQLPLLDRQTLHDRWEELAPPGETEPSVTRRTSGSTGRPVQVRHGPATVGFAAAARLRQLTWFGLEARDHAQLNTRIAAEADAPPLVRDGRDPPLWWLNPYALDRDTLPAVHRDLVREGGVRLIGAESSLMAALAELYAKSGLDGRELGARLVVAGGEMTYAEQKEAARRAFGCPAAEMYGSHELAILATECPEGSLHVAEESVLIELLDADGEAVAPGARGEVVATLLHNSPMPILRYRLGDTAVFEPGPCACGRPAARLHLDVARLEEMVLTPTGDLLHPRFLRSIYERVFGTGLNAFHTVQTRPLEFVACVDADAYPESAEAVLAEEIASYLGAEVAVRIERGEVRRDPGKLATFTRL